MSNEEEKGLSPGTIKLIETGVNAITKLVSGIGLPGTLLIIIFYGIGRYATEKQKIEMIDKYVLFHETTGFIVISIFLILLTLIVYFQINNALQKCHSKNEYQKKEIERYQVQLMAKPKRKS